MPVNVLIKHKIDGESRFNKGWGELWVYGGSPTRLKDLTDVVSRFAESRAALNGKNTSISEVRLSKIGTKRATHTVYSYQVKHEEGTFSGLGGFGQFTSDQANACLIVSKLAANDQQKSRVYMAGLPDELLGTNPAGPRMEEVPGWRVAWESFKVNAEGGLWAFKARTVTTDADRFPLVSAALAAEAPFELIVQTPVGIDIADVGDQVQVRGFTTRTRGSRNPNGIYRVVAKTTGGAYTSYQLKGAVGFDPTELIGEPTIELVRYQYATIAEIHIVGQATRKRGVGPIRPRGRSSRRRR